MHSPARPTVGPGTAESSARPKASGKFLTVDGARFLVKGVTYGTFAPHADGHQFPDARQIAGDFALMAAHGINTVRTYTPPTAVLLDEAARHGLRVMAGLPWSQHVAFLADRRLRQEIRRSVASHVRELANHPALLMCAVGNEIPASVVRWHGRSQIERFIGELCDDAKSVAPECLLTYVNYPPTEYLDLPFLDVVAFNVYLHGESALRAYVTRLQLLAGSKPLLLAELGSDSMRNGEQGQAELTAMQVRGAFHEGACGAIAFAWTDEWWRGGFTVEDWAFGLVDAARRPKQALGAVESVFAEAPFPADELQTWPKVSVIVCAYNAENTIDECLAALEQLTYPDYEVIVVDDGSRDRTGDRARTHPDVRVIAVPNGGLSAARNVGLGHATGTIVAYTDADVRVDPDWLTFLVQPFLNSDVVGSGGPNVVPPEDPWVAQAIARAPGAPTHVLLDNRTAEHVPGCNMAFKRDVLLDVGGFNPIYQRAGDDVDICWRIMARGWRIGFAPAALVWHHHRASIRGYWRQQVGYGEGEQWLRPHHPDRFRAGWRGHIYSPLPYVRALRRSKVNTGPWGTAPFPSVYLGEGYPFAFMPHKIRWQVTAFALAAAGGLLTYSPYVELAWLFIGMGILGLATTWVKCGIFALHSDIAGLPPIAALPMTVSRILYRGTIAWLHFLQPIARGYGRLRGMLSDAGVPASGGTGDSAVRPSLTDVRQASAMLLGQELERCFWGESGTEAETLLTAIRDRLMRSREIRAVAVDDGWQADRDISVQVGRAGWLDLRVLVEDHGSGKRLARLGMRMRPVPSRIVEIVAVLALFPIGLAASMAWGGLTGPYLAVAAMLVSTPVWTWRASRTLAATRAAAAEAAESCMMRPVAPPPAGAPLADGRDPLTSTDS